MLPKLLSVSIKIGIEPFHFIACEVAINEKGVATYLIELLNFH